MGKAAIAGWGVLLAVRLAVSFLHLDCLPLLPSLPAEVLINDAALALATGHGLVAPGFLHSINGLDKMYAYFPPVYLFLQSLVFRWFGFSALTLRGMAPVNGILGLIVLLAVLREMMRQGLADRFGATVAGTLLILEPTSLIQSRQGRMDTTSVLFGAIAFWLTLRARRSPGNELALWTGSALVSGLAVATHPSAALLIVPLVLFSLVRVRRFGWVVWLAVNALPGVVFVGIWAGTYGAQSLAALRQMQRLFNYGPRPSLRLVEMAVGLAHKEFGAMQERGGLAVLVLVGVLLLCVLRFLLSGGQTREQNGGQSADWRQFLGGAVAALGIQTILIGYFLTASGPNRLVVAAPVAFLAAATALSWLPQVQRRILLLAAVFVLAELGYLAGYFRQTPTDAVASGPGRFDAVVASIEPGARVCAVPEFWFALHRAGRPVALIYHAVDESRYWNEQPGALAECDTVILDRTTADFNNLAERARLTGKTKERLLKTWRRDYELLEKPEAQR